MKSKDPASAKKQTVIVKDLKTKKDPKGGYNRDDGGMIPGRSSTFQGKPHHK